MLKLNSISLTIGAFLITSVFVACEKDDDDDNQKETVKPVIVLNEPVENEVFKAGNTMHLDGKITDNAGLSELRLDVHYAGDGHTHKTRAIEWAWDTTTTISGLEWNFHYDVTIPTDADSGVYHVMAYAIDAAGNQADFVSRDITIEHHVHGGDTESPQINLTTPNHTGEEHIDEGQSIAIEGNVTDNDHLEEIHIKLKRVDNNEVLEEIHLHHADLDDHNSHTLNNTVTVPTGLPMHSDLELEIEAKDETGNETHVHFEYHVH